MDFNIKLKNGQILRGMIQSPGERTLAVVIFVHGLGEHVHRYTNWADMFRKEGIGFAGVDLPGHGNSDGNRGSIKSYDTIFEMIDILLTSCRNTFPGIPLFLYGHSLGGGIVLNYLLHKNPKIKGAIVTSPWLRLSFEPAKSKVLLASVMRYLLPGLTQPSGLVVDHISHDLNVVEQYRKDPLVHDKISVALFHSAMSAASYSLSHPKDLKINTLLVHGSDDMICSVEGSREFATKTSFAELKIWEGGFHELHNEPFREEVFCVILNWINNQIS
jgi:alpha-beta hydrolase superfamily lysophospholipase